MILDINNIETMSDEEKLVWKCLDNKSHRGDLVEIMYSKYGDLYICSKSGVWYEYKNHKYVEVKVTVIRDRLTLELSELFSNFMKKYLVIDLETNIETEIKNKIDICIIIIQSLKNTNYKTGIYKQACYRFYDESLDDNMNKNKNLICFTNGVFDFSTNTFRQGNRKDRITMCTGYDYEEYTWNHNDVVECMNYLKCL